MTIRSVGIIGAGFAGLSTAKVLRAFGFEVTVFEKEPDVGGVWAASRRYPGLTTQNPRTTYALSDFPMPADYPEWPSGQQVQAYLHAYAEHFGLIPHLRMSTTVESAVLDEEAGVWTVKARRALAGQGGALPAEVHRFDYLVVCNGIFSEPAVPQYPGADAFEAAGGRVCHTSQFNDADEARGKHVLVVGYGKSSCDVANAIAADSASTTVLARQLIWKIPKKFMNVLNFKFLLLTRMGEALFKYIEPKGFEKFLHGAGLPVRNSMLGSVESVVTRQLKLREIGLHPGTPLETIARSTVSLVTDGFYEKVAAGTLGVRKGVSIRALQPGQAVLSNGETVPADLVVCGTGWQQQVPFFDSSVLQRVTDARGNFRLYRSILPVGMPRLAFNGYNSSFFSQLNCEIGALWLANHLRGGLQLPPQDQMNAQIDRRLAWMEERTDGKHSKGTNIIPFSVHNIDELLQDMELPLGAFTRFRQWLEPVNPSDYAVVTRQLLARHAGAPATAAAPQATSGAAAS
ncbi:putative flavoprotein involved in K+ transport [Acidovorax sp. CF316]|uniref:flavin-containing monooxygenase n=1 Tax=Acidovorax sp. CF316 TaxID=1144317 RepID=UPI00026BC3B8|nr:NAD(P)/FAD-dependent oxidoreductase [Acidovorax sp. CF316]EJE50771.1 putative flavoprotein involved in K+ transport [Acidovorax sp. CF316]